MTKIEQLLLKLLRIPSFSSQEKNIGEFIIRQLKGFKITKQYIKKDRFNIIARKGDSKKWLVAHMDTVQGNLPVKMTKDKIFGRGACDNKQSIAASIIVGNELKDINLLFTVGEEVDFVGAKAAKIKGNLIVVQEPTDFKIITGQNGIIEFVIKTTGQRTHSSSDKIDSANNELIKILSDLNKKQWTCFNVGLISGGIASNVVADKAEAVVSARPKDIIEYKNILSAVKKINAKIEFKNDFKPCASNLIFPKFISRYFTEIAFFKNSIQFGAGDINFAHSDKECILREDLNVLPEKLTNLLMKSK
jgi:acetylornithine deacetylase/succinyl-diaminopimelate desuccinylase-like protein